MKNLKKMLASLVVVAMMASMAIVPAFAEAFSYEKEAVQLNKVGLYLGISETEFVPDLGTKLDRQTGVVMLLRMFGQEEEAKLLTDEQANALLAKFTDAGTIADWAKRQVAYAVEKGVVKGYEDSTFRPSAGLNGKAYASLLLQQLGYDGEFDYHQAAVKLSQVGGLTASQAATFNSDAQLNKDALVGISYGSLQAKMKADGKKLVKFLIETKVIDEEKVKEAEIPYADIVSVADVADVKVDIGGTPALPATVTATYDNGTTGEVAVTWGTVDTSKAGEFEVVGTIADTTVTATVKVIVMPAELTVSGKTSGNRKELVLEFNRPLEDADKAKNTANYRVKKYSVENADLSEDKMTVTLLVSSLMKQQEDITVTVDKDLGLKEDTDVVIKNVKDVTAPEVESVEAVGNSLLKVRFTEPVENVRSVSNYTINGKAFAASKITVANNKKVVSIHLKNPLEAGTHKLVVKDKVVDFAGFKIEDNETEFTVVEDKEAPTGEVESATQTKVVIKFSEPVKEPNESDVSTSTSAKISNRKLDDDDMTYTIEFEIANPLPASGGKLTIKNLSDYSGNKTDFSVIVEPKYDVEKPEYVGYKVEDNQKKIVVEFSEDVSLNVNNYELLNADGDEIAIEVKYAKNDKKEDVKSKVVITKVSGTAFASEKHKLTIDGVKDLSPIKNEIDKITVTIEVDDQQAPTVEQVVIDTTYDSDAKEDRNALYITFSEDVDYDTATDFDNYAFTVEGDKTIFDLDKDFADIDLLSDERTVVINFDKKDNSKENQKEGVDYVDVIKITKIQIDSVKDTAGNEMSRQAIDTFKVKNASLAPKVLSAAVTGQNTIEVKIQNKINDKTLSPSDFDIYAETDKGVVAIEAYDAEYKSSDDKIKLFINQDLDANGTFNGARIYLVLVPSKDISTVNAFEQKLTIGNKIDVTDSYNPTIDSVAKAVYLKGTGTYAEIELTEALDLDEGKLDEGKLDDAQASQFVVRIGDDIVDAEIYYYYDGAAEDDKKTEDVNESKARFIVRIAGDKANDELNGKTIKVSFIPVADSKANRDAGAVITDIAGNALKEKTGLEKKITK